MFGSRHRNLPQIHKKNSNPSLFPRFPQSPNITFKSLARYCTKSQQIGSTFSVATIRLCFPSIRRSMLECSSEFGNSQRCECRFICPEDVFNLGPGSTHLDEACVSLSPAQVRPVLANCLLYSYLDLHKTLGKSKKHMKHIIPNGSLMAMNPIVQSVKNHPLNKSKLTSSNRPDVDIPCIVNWNHPLFWWTCEGHASPEYPPPTSNSYLVSLGKKKTTKPWQPPSLP